MIVGCKVYHLDEVNSTNEYAKSLTNRAPEGAVILADLQTAGKGRLDRKWYSPEGGIWMSVILRPQKPNLIPVIGGIAICEAFNSYDILLGLKWPNDVLLNNKKVAGILTENVDGTSILGIGINLNIYEFPTELRSIASSIIIETEKNLDKMEVFYTICKELDTYYFMLTNNRIPEILLKWRLYTIMFGKAVRVVFPDRVIVGRFIDISSDGSLVIASSPDGKIERVIGGECLIIKE